MQIHNTALCYVATDLILIFSSSFFHSRSSLPGAGGPDRYDSRVHPPTGIESSNPFFKSGLKGIKSMRKEVGWKWHHSIGLALSNSLWIFKQIGADTILWETPNWSANDTIIVCCTMHTRHQYRAHIVRYSTLKQRCFTSSPTLCRQ